MEQNTDRMGFALIALSVVAFVLLAVTGILQPTVKGFFNGFNKWEMQTFDGINESNKQEVTHTAYANIVSLCKENSNFTLSEASLVRYGSDSRWVYKELQAGAYTASNTFFGSDPASGTYKNVELVSDFSTVYSNLNLLDGTKDFSGTWDRTGGWINDGTYKGLTVKKKSANMWNGINKTFTAPKDGDYTFSAYIKASGATTSIIRYREINGVGKTEWLKDSLGNNFDWRSDTVTVSLKAGQTALFRYEIASNNADSILWNAGHKWEEGSTATPYMPSASEVKPSDQPKYIGTYVDKNETASQEPSRYTWKLNPDYHE